MSLERALAVVASVVAVVTIASALHGRAIEQRRPAERWVLAFVIVILSIVLIVAIQGRKPPISTRSGELALTSSSVTQSASSSPGGDLSGTPPIQEAAETQTETVYPKTSVSVPPAVTASTSPSDTEDCDLELGHWRGCAAPPMDIRVDRTVAWSSNPVKSGNVRAGPGTNYPVVAAILPYEVAKVIGKVEGTGWYLIRHDIASSWGDHVPAYINQYYPDASRAEVYVSGELFNETARRR